MNYYKKILVPLDGSEVSEKIFPEVEKVIEKNQTEIHILRVVAHMHRISDFDIAEFEAAIVRDAEKYIEKTETALKNKGYKVQGCVRVGFDADEIIRYCEENPDIELIAMSTHGRSGVGRWFLGSVAEKVIRHATRPLILVRPEG